MYEKFLGDGDGALVDNSFTLNVTKTDMIRNEVPYQPLLDLVNDPRY